MLFTLHTIFAFGAHPKPFFFVALARASGGARAETTSAPRFRPSASIWAGRRRFVAGSSPTSRPPSFSMFAIAISRRSPAPSFSLANETPSNQARTAARLRKSACRIGSGIVDLQRLAVRTTAVFRLTLCPTLTTTVFFPKFGRSSIAKGSPVVSPSFTSGAQELASCSVSAIWDATRTPTSLTLRTSFATPIVGKSVRIPKCVAEPQRLGWKTPLPSTRTAWGVYSLGIFSNIIFRAGTSRKARKPTM
mmetsp:Transcript_99521/g.157494  ORF Transcript_99521/g.157494 Transcript_99521/m.157494 type:complete len:249 (+) Transcript_99521:318-1064(+)